MVDRASRWDLRIRVGTVSERDLANLPWDPFGGLPDVYVEVEVAPSDPSVAHVVYTGASSDTLSPVWLEIVDTGLPASVLLDHVHFVELWDLDGLSPPSVADDSMGECVLEIEEAAFSGAGQALDCPRMNSRAGWMISWALTPAIGG